MDYRNLEDIIHSEDKDYKRKRIGEYIRKACLSLIIGATIIVAIYYHTYLIQSFRVFGVAVLLLALLCYVIYPLCVTEAFFNTKKQKFVYREKHLNIFSENVNRSFYGFLGTGEVLLGNFGDGGEITYDFFCICYMPVFPIRCYRKSGNYSNPIKGSWREVIYIYFRQWLIVVICLSSLSVFAYSLSEKVTV